MKAIDLNKESIKCDNCGAIVDKKECDCCDSFGCFCAKCSEPEHLEINPYSVEYNTGEY